MDLLNHSCWPVLFWIIAVIKFGESVWRTKNWNSRWDDWWHYKEGAIGGPDYWGQVMFMAYTKEIWPACHLGRRQSPINISASDLIYDHTLTPIRILGDNKPIEIRIINEGQDINIHIESDHLTLKGGPLSYDYRIFGATLKFGSNSMRGSEHRINNAAFPAELQIYAFNSVLHKSYSTALTEPGGIAVIACFLKLGNNPSDDLSALISTIEKVELKGQVSRLEGLLLRALLPSTEQYLTYEGSLPFPACHESVTWIVLNQPIDITETQLKSLRQLRMSTSKTSGRMADNFRPMHKLNNRSVRTNINTEKPTEFCSIRKDVYYDVNVP